MMSRGHDHVLSDLRVLDFTRNLAGPSCTWMLVEMGADVFKVEPALLGDRSRSRRVEVRSSFNNTGANGASVSICVTPVASPL